MEHVVLTLGNFEILASNLVSKVSSYISGIKFLISNSKIRARLRLPNHNMA